MTVPKWRYIINKFWDENKQYFEGSSLLHLQDMVLLMEDSLTSSIYNLKKVINEKSQYLHLFKKMQDIDNMFLQDDKQVKYLCSLRQLFLFNPPTESVFLADHAVLGVQDLSICQKVSVQLSQLSQRLELMSNNINKILGDLSMSDTIESTDQFTNSNVQSSLYSNEQNQDTQNLNNNASNAANNMQNSTNANNNKACGSNDINNENNSKNNVTNNNNNNNNSISSSSNNLNANFSNLNNQDSQDDVYGDDQERFVKKIKGSENTTYSQIARSNSAYSEDTRIRILKEALENYNINQIANKHNINPSLLRRWRKQYKDNPEIRRLSLQFDEIQNRKKYYNFSLQQKQEIIEEYRNADNQPKLLNKYKIHPRTIEKWMKEQQKQKLDEINSESDNSNEEEEKSNQLDPDYYICKLKGEQINIDIPQNDLLDDDLLRKIRYDNNYSVNAGKNAATKLEDETNSEQNGYLFNICIINLKEEDQQKFKRYYGQIVACNDGPCIKIFLKKLDNDQFKLWERFRVNGKPIKLMKSINNIIVVLTGQSIIEVWKWQRQQKLIEKQFEFDNITDFTFYKKTRDSLLLLQTTPTEIKIMNIKTLVAVRTISFQEPIEQLSCISMVDFQTQVFDKGKLLLCDKNRLKIIQLSGEIIAELEVENCQYIKFIERFNLDHIILLTNTNELNVVYFRVKSKIQIITKKMLEFKPTGIRVFHTSNEQLLLVTNDQGISIFKSIKLILVKSIEINTKGHFAEGYIQWMHDIKSKQKLALILCSPNKSLTSYTLALNNFF